MPLARRTPELAHQDLREPRVLRDEFERRVHLGFDDVDRIRVRDRGAQPVGEQVDAVPKQRVDQAVLRAEVVVDGALRDARLGGDVVDGQPGQAPALREPERGLEKLLLGQFGACAHRLSSGFSAVTVHMRRFRAASVETRSPPTR